MFRRGGFAILVKCVAKYEVFRDGEATAETVPSPERLFPRVLLHSSAIAHVITSKFALGVPPYRLEQDLADQGLRLDRGTMSRYVEHAGNVLGATIVHAMWQHALAHAYVIRGPHQLEPEQPSRDPLAPTGPNHASVARSRCAGNGGSRGGRDAAGRSCLRSPQRAGCRHRTARGRALGARDRQPARCCRDRRAA